MKIMICQKYSFQKLTEFSQGDNVVDAVAAKIDGYLWGDTCVSSTQRNRPIWSKQSQFAPCNTEVAGSILFKS
jgi:hypothetical protein